MSPIAGIGIFLAASVISVPTPPGVPSTDVTAHHGSVYQTTSDGKVTQGFLEIDNTGAADELTGAACPIADNTSLVGDDGETVLNLTIPARQSVVLKPGGAHLMLQGLHFSVQYGGIIPCSLTFAGAGTVSVFLYATPAP
jgi:copper(I)-binding protein